MKNAVENVRLFWERIRLISGYTIETWIHGGITHIIHKRRGKFHRVDGPAVLAYDKDGNLLGADVHGQLVSLGGLGERYFINGIELSVVEFEGLDEEKMRMLESIPTPQSDNEDLYVYMMKIISYGDTSTHLFSKNGEPFRRWNLPAVVTYDGEGNVVGSAYIPAAPVVEPLVEEEVPPAVEPLG